MDSKFIVNDLFVEREESVRFRGWSNLWGREGREKELRRCGAVR